MVLNILVGKIADKIDNYSNFIEFSRLEGKLKLILDIINNLNKKLEKIHNKIYELLKLLLQNKINKTETDGEVEDKIEELTKIIQKYFDKVENIDEEKEKKIIEDVIKFEEEMFNNSAVNDEWIFINIIKD